MTRYPETVRCHIFLAPVAALFLVGCGSSQEVAKAPVSGQKGAVDLPSKPLVVNGKVHPLAKNIELGGFRVAEPKPGSIRVKFNVVNHSQADLGDIEMNVSLVPAGAQPGDTPLCVLRVKVPNLGPEESKAVEATIATKLRVYELPDWQFIRAMFEVTVPPA